MRNGRIACADCRLQVSVTAGTRLEDCRIPLRTVLLAARHAVARPEGLSARQLQSVAGLSRYETALNLVDRFRIAMAAEEELRGRIAACVKMIPLAGSGSHGATVLVALVDGRSAGPRLLIRQIRSRTASCVTMEIVQHIADGSCLLTRPADEFAWLAKLDSGYLYSAIRDEDSSLLERCEAAGDTLRDWLRKVYHGAVRIEKFQGYCDEFAFRYEYGASPEQAYDELLRRLFGGPEALPKYVV